MSTLRDVIKDVIKDPKGKPHPGLVLDYGLSAFDGASKGAAIKSVFEAARTHRDCPLYRAAYDNWECYVTRACVSRKIKLKDRMHIGMGMPSVMETNVTLHPLYGLPMIPGDTLKGALRAHWQRLKCSTAEHDKWGRDFERLLGKPDEGGAIVLHDAWWIPDSADSPDSPLCLEVDTPHQPAYYKSGGKEAASDFDDPNPVSELAVQGSFLIAIEKRWLPDAWATFALDLLHEALEHGIGGRVNAGYGRFKPKAQKADQ